MSNKPTQKIKFRIPTKTILEKLYSFFGNKKWDIGYFHCKGFSGNQKNNKHDILIIEKEDGIVITIPNKTKYYQFI